MADLRVVGRAGEVDYPAAPDEDSNGRALLARRPRFTKAAAARFLRLCACSVFVGLMLLIALPPSPDRIFDRASLRRDIPTPTPAPLPSPHPTRSPHLASSSSTSSSLCSAAHGLADAGVLGLAGSAVLAAVGAKR